MECKNVLIIEDDPAVRQTMKDVLDLQGYKTFTASNGKEGFDQLKSMEPEPCVILLDLMMPVMNGWDFIDAQRNDLNFRKIPVIVCSAYEETAKSIKPVAFVEKPLALEKLLTAVKAFCG